MAPVAQEVMSDDVPLEASRAAEILEGAFGYLSSEEWAKGSDRHQSVLKDLAGLSAYCPRLLALLPDTNAAHVTRQTSFERETQRQLPRWAKALSRFTDLQRQQDGMAVINVLSVLVSGFSMIGMEAAAGDEGRRDYALVNICWKSVMSILTSKEVVQALNSPDCRDDEGSQEFSAPLSQSEVEGLQGRPTEVEDVVDILLRLTAISLCRAVRPILQASDQRLQADDEGKHKDMGDTGNNVKQDASQYQQQILVVKFFQNNAIRLAAQYPAATLHRSVSVLVSLACCISTLLRKEGGPLSSHCRTITATVLGGHLYGLLTSLLACDYTGMERFQAEIVQHLCQPSAGSVQPTGASSAETSLKHLEILSAFSSELPVEAVDNNRGAWDSQASLDPGGQLLVLACCLEGSKKYGSHVLQQFVKGLPSVADTVRHPSVYSHLVSHYTLPGNTKKAASHGAEVEDFILFHRLSSSLRVMTAATLVLASASEGQLPRPEETVSHSPLLLLQEGKKTWESLQVFLLQCVTSSHPILSELPLEALDAATGALGPEFSVSLTTSLLLILERGVALDTCLVSRTQATPLASCDETDHSRTRGQTSLAGVVGSLNSAVSRVVVRILDNCPSAAYRQIVPGLLRRCSQSLTAGGRSLVPLVRVCFLLQNGLARTLERRSVEDLRSLIGCFTQLLLVHLKSLDPSSHTSQSSTEDDFLHQSSICGWILSCLVSVTEDSTLLPTERSSTLTNALRAIHLACEAVDGSQKSSSGLKRSRSKFEEASIEGDGTVLASLIVPSLTIVATLLRPGDTHEDNGLPRTLTAFLRQDSTKESFQPSAFQSTTLYAAIKVLQAGCSVTSGNELIESALQVIAIVLQSGSPSGHLALQEFLVSNVASEKGPQVNMFLQEAAQQSLVHLGASSTSGSGSGNLSDICKWWATFSRSCELETCDAPPAVEDFQLSPAGDSFDVASMASMGLHAKDMWAEAQRKSKEGIKGKGQCHGVPEAGSGGRDSATMDTDRRRASNVQPPSHGNLALGKGDPVQHNPNLSSRPNVLCQLDTACRLLQDAVDNMQESGENLHVSAADVMERVQEAEGVIRKFKSICRRMSS